jgi:hypothetical protein
VRIDAAVAEAGPRHRRLAPRTLSVLAAPPFLSRGASADARPNAGSSETAR